MIIDFAKVYRNNRVESIHYGIACLAGSGGSIKTWGDAKFSCYTRSIIKPIQAKIALDILGADLSGKSLAIALSSHNAEAEQLEAVRLLMNKFKIEESDLRCGTYTGSRELPSKIHHNCSGKHTALIAACKKQNWDIGSYYEESHPIQILIKNEILRLSEQKSMATAIDGCGLQTFYLSIETMAKTFVNLINDIAYAPIINCMNEYPLIIGGSEQIDSRLMQEFPRRFIAKGGAEGLMAIGDLKQKQALIIKVIDGSNRAKAVISLNLLEEIAWLKPAALSLDRDIYNSCREKIGYIK
jgi:L-asparaginase